MPSLYDWSKTAGTNASADANINWAEGQLPSTVNDSARQMMARMAEWRDDLGALALVGTDTLTLTANSAFTTYATGRRVIAKVANTNTGAVTLNVNGIGAKAVRKVTSSGGEVALIAGDLRAGLFAHLVYDTAANAAAGAWILMNPASTPAADLLTSVASGAVGTPSIAFSGDTNTGIYRAGAGLMGFVTNGTEAARFDASQRLLVGHTAVVTMGGSAAKLQVSGSSDNTAATTVGRWSADNSGAALRLFKSRNATIGSSTAVTQFDVVGTVEYIADTGASASQVVADVRGATETTVSGGNVGGRWLLRTSTSGGVLTEAMRVTSDQSVLIGTTSKLDATSGTTNGMSFDATVNTLTLSRTSSPALVVQRGATDGDVVQFYRGTVANGRITLTSAGTTATLNTASDRRLKENIRDFDGAGAMIDAIQPRRYAMTSNGIETAGFIADEFQAVLPNIVTGEPGGEEMQSIAYAHPEMFALLVAALKETRAELAAAKARIAALEAGA